MSSARSSRSWGFALPLSFAAWFLVGPCVAQTPVWKEAVDASLAAKEYEFSPGDDGGRSAPNRASNLRTHVSTSGVAVSSRVSPSWQVHLRTSRIGRASAMHAVGEGAVSSSGNRAEIHRPGLIEWYVNHSSGVEQGFTLEARPSGEGALWLEMAIESGARAELDASGSELTFHDAKEELVLRYAGLVVLDARNENITARLVLAGTTLRIEFEDESAVYPLTIDPLMTTPSESTSLRGSNSSDWRPICSGLM